MSTTSPAASVTVEQYTTMLRDRSQELTYTDTGGGWSLNNTIRSLPVDEVTAILLGQYGAGAQLTEDMISAIDWLDSGGTTDFRRTRTKEDDVAGQLIAVLRGAAIPELTRGYPCTGVNSKVATRVNTTTIDTYVDERRSYCESCDTHKKNVQWWTAAFKLTSDQRAVMSACKSCLKHVPQCQRDMTPSW